MDKDLKDDAMLCYVKCDIILWTCNKQYVRLELQGKTEALKRSNYVNL